MKQPCALLIVFCLAIGPFAEARQKPAVSAAPAASSFAMTIDNIMRGNGLFGYPISAVRWSPDSQHAYFQWKKYDEAREKPNDTYVINADGGGLRKLSEDEAKDAPPALGAVLI